MSTMIPPPVQPAPQPKSKRFGWVALLIAVGCSLIVGSCTGALARGGGGGDAAGPAPTVTKTVTQKAEAPAEKPAEDPKPAEKKEEPAEEPAGIGDGIYEVGVDIEPGRYKVGVPDDSILCSYKRLKDDTGDTGSIIALEVKQPGARASVTIKKSDGFFETSGCGEWTKS